MTTGGAVGKTSLRASIIAGALLLACGAAQAAGLGKLTVLSHLGEPLRAEIDVVALEKGELETLKARLASPDAYVQSNLPYPPPSLGLRLEVDKRSSGEPYISITSQQPVPEPFVDLLIELNWNSGKILRAYTALLDPPAFAAAPPEMATPAPTREAAAPPPPPEPPVETQLGSELQREPPPPPPAGVVAEPLPTEPLPAEPQPAEPPPAGSIAQAPPAEAGMPPKPAPAPAAQSDTYGPVKYGDTLSKIAKEYKPDDVTLEQMLVLLYRNNKGAFSGSNMNRLKTGKVLTVPDPSEASGISPKEARKQVRVQVADFNAYRERLAAAAGEAMSAPEQPGKAAGGRVTGPVADKGAPAAGEPKEVLKLGKGEAPGAGGKAMQDKVRSLEEDVAARDKTIREANDRIAKLEKTVKDMTGLLEAKNKTMAELQKPAAPPAAMPAKPVLPAAPPEKPLAAVPPPAPPPAMPAPAKPDTHAAMPATPASPPEVAPHVGPMAASGTTPGMQGGDVKPKPKPRPRVIAPPPEPSLVDQLMGDPLYLAAGGVVLLLVLGFLAYRIIRSRRGNSDDAVGAEKKTSEVRAFVATGTDNTGAMAAAARAAQAQITEEVDPLAEAEIYLAYGRDGQAEEILKEAIQSHPKRHEVHLKLLEIFAKRKDLAAFDPLARDLQQATGGQGEVWMQAARMGYQLDPANPRYLAGKPSGAALAAAAAAATASGTSDKTLDFQIDSLDASPEIGTLTDIDAGFGRRFATTTAAATSASADRLDLNVSLDEGQAVGTKTDIDLGRLGAPDGSGMDLDLDSLGGSSSPGSSTDIDFGSLDAGGADSQPAMDFNLDLPAVGEEKTESQMASVDSVDFDLKFDDADAASSAKDTGLEFDLDQISLTPRGGKSEPVLDLERSAPAMPEIDLSSISLDLGADLPMGGDAAGPRDDKWYDVQTKFDLAKAYQEMGDKEGAREILREVIAEGDSEQQAAAQKVLEALS